MQILQLSLTFCILFFVAFFSKSQDSTISTENKSKQLMMLLKTKHLSPINLKDSVNTELVHQLFLETLDPEQILFTQKEEDACKQKVYTLAEDISKGELNYYNCVKETYFLAIEKYLKWLETVKVSDLKPIHKDFENNQVTNENQKYYYGLNLREFVYERTFNSLTFNKTTISNDSIQRVLEREFTEFKNSFKEYQNNLQSTNIFEMFYLNAIASAYDPHSEYFNSYVNQAFNNELNPEEEIYGVNYSKETSGKFIITQLVPGSSAWNSGKIHVGDEIVSVQFGSGLEKQVEGLTYFQLKELFNNDEELLKLKIKQDNQIIEISLLKTKIISDEDNIKTAILNGDNGKIGYISLPDFYLNWTDTTFLGCANDVAKSIVKLKRNSIDGIILDLRNNGGGSLQEAIDLVGIFINYGPVLVGNSSDGSVFTMKDFNRGLIYNGPLVIMINENSASASEVVAGALQDYNRALIVGTQSFGKATGQMVFSLDPLTITNIMFDPNEEWGFLKVTDLGLHRVNLTTNQINGVQPDIELEHASLFDATREKDYANPLILPKVEKKIYMDPLLKTDVSLLQAKSQNRQEADESLQKIKELSKQLQEHSDFSYRFATLEEMFQENIELDNLLDKINEIEEESTSEFQVESLSDDTIIHEMNSYKNQFFYDFKTSIEQDLELEETYKIIIDLIQIK